MNVVMDACSVINLRNGGVLETVCSLPEFEVQIGPIAGGECSEDCAAALAALHEVGLIDYVTDSPLEADQFLDFVDQHRLGDGEAECIMLAALDAETMVCCDDLRGRKKAQLILGQERLVGSIGLLKCAVANALMSPDEAYAAYQLMRNAGGFLPDLNGDYFAPA